MIKRIDIGTDIAMIGVWDPAHERHDLLKASYKDLIAAQQTEANEGRLFYINTGADGGYLTHTYVDEQPDSETLKLYTSVVREFLIRSESGRLIAGGLEDFVSSTKQITSEQDEFAVTPGSYALRIYQLNDQDLLKHIEEQIGVEDYTYYSRKSDGFPWGCLPFVVAVCLLFAKQWLAALGMLALGVTYVSIRSRILGADHRFQEIGQRIKTIEEQFPPFIYVLRRLNEDESLEGGWYDLK